MTTKEYLGIKEYKTINWEHADLTAKEFEDFASVLRLVPYHVYRIDGLYNTFHTVRNGNKTIISVSEVDDRKIRVFINFWLNNEFTVKTVFDDTLEHDFKRFKKHCKSDNAIMYCCGNNTYLFFDLNEIMK